MSVYEFHNQAERLALASEFMSKQYNVQMKEAFLPYSKNQILASPESSYCYSFELVAELPDCLLFSWTSTWKENQYTNYYYGE